MPGKPIPDVTELNRPYWAAARRDELHLQRNTVSGKHFLIPRHWAADDFSSNLEWVAASGRGRIVAYTVAVRPLFDSYAADVPYVVAIVQLDEGPTMMANIVHCAPEAVRVDLRVRVVFEWRGADLKVPQFEPL